MNAMKPSMVYNVRHVGMLQISEVKSGLQCDDIRTDCNQPLVAKKGTEYIHHFAHHDTDPCECGYESYIHKAAKQILADAGKMWIPAVYLTFDTAEGPAEKKLLRDAMEIKLDRIVLEKRLHDIVPDLLATIGKQRLIIEICASHKIDKKKMKKIRDIKISTIEIDLYFKDEYLVLRDHLETIVLGNSPQKQWRHNEWHDRQKRRFLDVADSRRVIRTVYGLHTEYCPLDRRNDKGKAYADYKHDCVQCMFFLYAEKTREGRTMWCTGRQRIADLKDFSLTIEERHKKYQEKDPYPYTGFAYPFKELSGEYD